MHPLTTGEDVELLSGYVIPCRKTCPKVFGNDILRRVGEPIRELKRGKRIHLRWSRWSHTRKVDPSLKSPLSKICMQMSQSHNRVR